MKTLFKKITKFFVTFIIKFLLSFNAGRYIIDLIIERVSYQKVGISYKKYKYTFYTPNRLNYFRAKTFLTKEPETIEWIENFDKDSIFWDVGANIGLYSCFASKEKNTKTYAFEPSMFNLELLSKNIFSNNLSDKIIIIPISLNDKSMVSSFNMSNIEVGGSMSTFSEKYSHDGKSFKPVFYYKTLGVSGNDFVSKLNIEKPDYVKIDVDGIEHLILNGVTEILNNTKSILIEVNENFELQKENVKSFLENKGFVLESKKQSDMIKSSGYNSAVFNQIWSKKL